MTQRESDVAVLTHTTLRNFGRIIGDYTIRLWREVDAGYTNLFQVLIQAVDAATVTDGETFHAEFSTLLLADGWVVGPERDYSGKIEPELVAWASLTPAVQLKYILAYNLAVSMLTLVALDYEAFAATRADLLLNQHLSI